MTLDGWSLVYDGFDPSQEKLREALCVLGNGFFATRGAAPESVADAIHYPGTYAAGCYNRLQDEIAELFRDRKVTVMIAGHEHELNGGRSFQGRQLGPERL